MHSNQFCKFLTDFSFRCKASRSRVLVIKNIASLHIAQRWDLPVFHLVDSIKPNLPKWAFFLRTDFLPWEILLIKSTKWKKLGLLRRGVCGSLFFLLSFSCSQWQLFFIQNEDWEQNNVVLVKTLSFWTKVDPSDKKTSKIHHCALLKQNLVLTWIQSYLSTSKSLIGLKLILILSKDPIQFSCTLFSQLFL